MQYSTHLIYGCAVWSQTSKKNTEMINVLQKKCLRIITFSNFRAHTNDLFMKVKIVKM